MKATFRSKYGAEDVLSIRNVDIPVPGPNDILIKVHATTVNRSDCHLLRGTPYLIRLFTGLLRPKMASTGTDFAGQIIKTGDGVTSFKVGDNIMGFGGGFMPVGSHADYFLVSEAKASKIAVRIPTNVSFGEAAACMEGAFYAACQVCPLEPKPGQKALVYGATGAIGSAYVQILKHYGVYTTAVCKGDNSELVKSLGADKIIDFTREDFTKDDDRYDFIFDAVGKSSFFNCKRLLKQNGLYTSSDGFINLILIFTTRLTGGKKVVFSTPKSFNSVLLFIKGLIESGEFRAVIDRRYTLDQIVDAFHYVAAGQKIGNVIVSMEAD